MHVIECVLFICVCFCACICVASGTHRDNEPVKPVSPAHRIQFITYSFSCSYDFNTLSHPRNIFKSN